MAPNPQVSICGRWAGSSLLTAESSSAGLGRCRVHSPPAIPTLLPYTEAYLGTQFSAESPSLGSGTADTQASLAIRHTPVEKLEHGPLPFDLEAARVCRLAGGADQRGDPDAAFGGSVLPRQADDDAGVLPQVSDTAPDAVRPPRPREATPGSETIRPRSRLHPDIRRWVGVRGKRRVSRGGWSIASTRSVNYPPCRSSGSASQARVRRNSTNCTTPVRTPLRGRAITWSPRYNGMSRDRMQSIQAMLGSNLAGRVPISKRSARRLSRLEEGGGPDRPVALCLAKDGPTREVTGCPICRVNPCHARTKKRR